MNNSLKIKIYLEDVNNTINKKIFNIKATALLNPFYAIEADIISPFDSISDKDMEWVRQMIMNASLEVKRLFTTIEKNQLIPLDEILFLKRDFTICLATNLVVKQLTKNATAEMSRAKTLGDFSVSTKIKNNSIPLSKILEDTGNCVDNFKTLIKDIEASGITPASFVKGLDNARTRDSGRLWWLSDLTQKVRDGFASKKYDYEGRKWKAGFNNQDSGG